MEAVKPSRPFLTGASVLPYLRFLACCKRNCNVFLRERLLRENDDLYIRPNSLRICDHFVPYFNKPATSFSSSSRPHLPFENIILVSASEAVVDDFPFWIISATSLTDGALANKFCIGKAFGT